MIPPRTPAPLARPFAFARPRMPMHVPITWLDDVDSTQRHARRMVEGGGVRPEDGPAAFAARVQTGGVGRHGRAWSSPPGGLWMTVCIPAHESVGGRWRARIGLDLGVAALGVCARAAGTLGVEAPLRLRWPNDLMLGDGKLGGLLTEAVSANGRRWWLVGIGINAAVDPMDWPEEVRRRAVALAPRGSLPTGWLERFAGDQAAALAGAAAGTVAAYDPTDPAWFAETIWRAGREVEVTRPDGRRQRGVSAGLTPDGELILLTADGPTRIASALTVEPTAERPGS